MQNSSLYIFGSKNFYRLIYDLNIFKKVYFGHSIEYDKNSILVVFVESFSSIFLNSFYKLNFPIIFISNSKEKKSDKLNLNNFSVFLNTPIDLQNFIEISKILISKFNYLKFSQISVKKYLLNSNDRFIKKDNKKLKLTEIEVKLILFLNVSKGFSKEEILGNIWKQKLELDTHAFETCLHRLRKKIKDKFDDDSFINFKNDKYYLL